MATNSENTPARRVDDKRPAGHLDWNNPEQPVATAFAYEIKPRAAEVGGGWALALLENGSEVGGGVFPVTEKTSADDAHSDAMEQGEEWLAARQAPPLTAPAPITDELRKLVNAHCNDLLDCAAILHDDGRFKRTAEEIRTAVAELRAAMKAAPAPQQSELSDERIIEIMSEHVNCCDRQAIDFAHAIEREVAKAAPAAPVQTADVQRYQRLRILGAAPGGTKQLDAGTVLRFQSLDDFVDADIAAYPSRGEAKESVATPVQAEQAQAEPVAYLHQVVSGDGEPDQALSFAPDNFPLAGTLGYRSISHQPLYTAPVVALPAQAEQLAAVRAAYENAAMVCQKMYVGGEGGAGCAVAADRIRALATKEAAAIEEPSEAALDVLAERRRQVEQEGWTPECDDKYQKQELRWAAFCYMRADDITKPGITPGSWPWLEKWWKPTTDRRNLVKACALVLAEIERLDRAAQQSDMGGDRG